MELQTYIDLTRYLTTIVFSFFGVQFFLSLLNYYDLREKASLWHTAMCLTTAGYCFIFAFNTHFFTQKLSNFNLIIFWIFAYCSYFCYLKTVEAFIGHSIKLLKGPKLFCLIFCSIQILCAISYSLFEYNFLFNFHSEVIDTLFTRTMHFTVSPNLIAKLLGGLGALVVFFSSYIIWRELNKLNKKEVFLRVGIILTVMVVLNDSALGLELTGAILPLYYIGNAFEAVRFNLHYQQKAAQKVYHLENEIVRLSKIAQFGFATASVAHDIANHLAIIKLTINKLIKGKTKANHIDLYKMISKHNDKVSEISTLYMNLFNKNSTSKKSNNSVKEIIDDTIELVDQKISSSNIELRLNIEDYQILCNPTEMTVCLVNLLKNAIDEVSSTSKYQAPWVSITTSRNLKRIYVSDCGDGIAPEKVKSMFDLGYSTKVNKGGHGIGLAITKQLLTRSGLSLDVDHNAKNTTFVISS